MLISNSNTEICMQNDDVLKEVLINAGRTINFLCLWQAEMVSLVSSIGTQRLERWEPSTIRWDPDPIQSNNKYKRNLHFKPKLSYNSVALSDIHA